MGRVIVSPSYGTIFGGNLLVLTGESFGVAQGSVTLEGRDCPIVLWNDTEVRATAPARITSGRRIATTESVVLVVTKADTETVSGTFQYRVSILTQALNDVRDSIARISPVTDPKYNFTITAKQIQNYQRDVADNTGAIYPQCLVFATETDYSGGQDEPYGFYTGKTPCIVSATMPLSEPCNWDEETRALMADLCRAIQLTRLTDAHALSFDITKATPGQETDPELGSLGSVIVEFDIVWKHIATNWNSVTEGE